MLRNIHFFNIKPGADEERILSLVDHELVAFAKTHGCIERKTWKLLDAHAGGQPVESAAYLNESLWPSQEAADAFSRTDRTGVEEWYGEMRAGLEVVKSIRYVDKEG